MILTHTSVSTGIKANVTCYDEGFSSVVTHCKAQNLIGNLVSSLKFVLHIYGFDNLMMHQWVICLNSITITISSGNTSLWNKFKIYSCWK